VTPCSLVESYVSEESATLFSDKFLWYMQRDCNYLLADVRTLNNAYFNFIGIYIFYWCLSGDELFYVNLFISEAREFDEDVPKLQQKRTIIKIIIKSILNTHI
jgi:hypothetical protein